MSLHVKSPHVMSPHDRTDPDYHALQCLYDASIHWGVAIIVLTELRLYRLRSRSSLVCCMIS